MFVNAYNDMMKNKSQLIEDIQEVITLLTNTIELDIKIASQRNEIDVISELIKKIVTENARKKQDQEDYNKRYSELVKRYDKAKLVLDKALEEKSYKESQATRLNSFLASVQNSLSSIVSWSDELWMIMIEKAVVHRDASVTFKFINGVEKRISHQSK